MSSQLIQHLPAALASGGALDALAAYRQFILYRLEPVAGKPGKMNKLPIAPQSCRNADAHDPAFWLSFDEAIAQAERLGDGYGVGFVFTEADPFFFVDIDGAWNGAEWSPVSVQLCEQFAGAAVEVSQSGAGLHIIGSASTVPLHGCKNQANGLELYTGGRFVALTGANAIGDASTDHTAALMVAASAYFPPSIGSTDTNSPAVWSREPVPEWNGPADDAELIEKAKESRGGNVAGQAFGGKAPKASFAALWTADPDALGLAYPDHYHNPPRPFDASSADAALASHLAFWTGCDCERIERIMRRSALARDKWDKHRSYLQRTITSAVKRCKSVYSGGLYLADIEDDTPADGHPDLSHDALARELSTVAGFSQDARYIPQWGQWLFWRNGRWEVDQKLYHITAVREFLHWKAKGLIRWANDKAPSLSDKDAEKIVNFAHSNAKALRQAGNVNSVENLARSNADLVANVDQFDSDLMLLGTPGGTVDLRTGELLTAHREHWITKHTAITPAPAGTTAPLWSSFLNRIFDNDQELISFIQRAAGYALTGHTSEHKLMFAYGTGSNGKSVFLNTLFGIMADYARRAPAQTFLDSVNDRHPTDLAGLHGARLVVGSELPAGKAWNESIVKDLTGGDVITARKMRQDFFEYTPQFTLFIAGNHQPSFQGIDEAIRRRVVLVPFTQTIPEAERDPALPEKLKAEWPSILRWMIDGAIAWQQQGLGVPQSVRAASDEYLDFEDTLGEFIGEHLERAPGKKATTAAIFERFSVWQRQNGIAKTWTKKAMTQALRERGFTTAKLSGGARGFRDMQLKPYRLPQPTANLAESAFASN